MMSVADHVEVIPYGFLPKLIHGRYGKFAGGLVTVLQVAAMNCSRFLLYRSEVFHFHEEVA
jgi:hypothetical protein